MHSTLAKFSKAAATALTALLLSSADPRAAGAQSNCQYAVVPATVSAVASDTTGTIGVTASDPSCGWAATSDASWLTVGAPTYGYPGQVLADGAIGYWRLNESGGTSVTDRSGHGLSGVATSSGVTWQQAGAVAGDTAASFDGTSGGIMAPAYAVQLTSALTAEVWVKTTNTSEWQTLVDHGFSGGEAWGLFLLSGVPRLEVQNPGNSTTAVMAPASVSDGQWHHIAGTWDGTTLRMYVDGVLGGTGSFAAPLLTTEQPIGIGQYPYTDGGFRLDGSLDDVAIYARALTGAEIAQHYALGLAAATATGSGVVAYAVAANPTSAARSATLTLGGETVTVTQAAWVAPTCTTTVNPSSVASGAAGAAGSLAVTETDPSCGWTATSDASWLTVGAPTYGYPGQVLADGAIGYWRLNESGGTSVADRSGHGLSGVATSSGVTWQQAGAVAGDTAALFNGTSGGITVPASEVQLTSALTAEGWVKTTSTSEWQTLVDDGISGGEAWGFFLLSGVPRLEVLHPYGSGAAVMGAASISDGQWHHIAGTWDGTTLRMYVDGVLSGIASFAAPLMTTDGPIGIGQYPYTDGGFRLDGSLDDVAIYDHALTSTQIAQHYALRASTSAAGPGVLAYAVAANPTSVARTATLTVAGETVTVTQEGVAIPPPPPPALGVSATTPAGGASGILHTPITATFSRAVALATISTATIELRDDQDVIVPATVSYNAATLTVTLTPTSPLAAVTYYTARVVGGSDGVKAEDGGELSSDVGWYFRTASAATAPAAAYPFSDYSGNSTSDKSDNGNIGTLLNGAAFTSGRFGDGVGFDGVDDELDVPPSDTLALTNAFTFEAWVDSTTSGGQLWSKRDASGTSLYTLEIQSDGRAHLEATTSAATYDVVSPSSLPPNTWTHVGVTYDGAVMLLYVNGVEVSAVTATGNLIQSNEPMRLGLGFAGVLDEVRMYRVALNAAAWT